MALHVPVADESQVAKAELPLLKQVAHVPHVPQRERFMVFRDFVLKTFPDRTLKSGPILDVAGGKGDLAWILSNADRLDVAIVDPRPSDHRKILRTAEWHHERRGEDLSAMELARGPQGYLAQLRLEPPWLRARHLQMPFTAMLLEALGWVPPALPSVPSVPSAASGAATSPSPSPAGKNRPSAAVASTAERSDGSPDSQVSEAPPQLAPLRAHTPPTDEIQTGYVGTDVAWAKFWDDVEAIWQPETTSQAAEKDDAADISTTSRRIMDKDEAKETFLSTSLILGFHPDQATDSCIDMALWLRRPFAVCPCCVFPAEFPNRRYRGNRVKLYDDFLGYLRAKHPNIRVAQLPFTQEGGSSRNIVLYMTEEDLER